MSERWRVIPRFPSYEASNLGRIRRIGGRVLKPCTAAGGYLIVRLSESGTVTRCKVAQLVLKTFVGPKPEKYDSHHKDGNKTNNAVSNLGWVTRSANIIHAMTTGLNGTAKLTPAQVREIRALHASGGFSLAALGDQFGVVKSTIHFIVHRQTWKTV